MTDVRTNGLSPMEQIAREVSNIDTAEFMINDEHSLDNIIENRNREKWNDKIDEMNKKFDEHAAKLQEYADEYAAKLDGVEIMPINTGILVQPYNENPFQKVKIDERTGLIIDTGGLIPKYKNNENGQWEEAEQFIKVGVVVEAGPDVKWIQRGDTIMWNKVGEVPIPFYSMGLVLVREQHVMCVINDKLTERFERLKNGN